MWSTALFVVFYNDMNDFWADIHKCVTNLNAKDSLFCFLTPLLLGVVCGILPASWKAILVFWRRNPLPGCRVFSSLAPSDPRIDMDKLEKMLINVPCLPKAQNSKWYEWYKEVQDEITVSESHKAFVLYRDLTGISFLFLIFGTITLLPGETSILNIFYYLLICFVQFLIFAVVARNHGNRFVCNVVVEYLAKT